jgi:hypothetical protein
MTIIYFHILSLFSGNGVGASEATLRQAGYWRKKKVIRRNQHNEEIPPSLMALRQKTF